jgi:hypothetical protein
MNEHEPSATQRRAQLRAVAEAYFAALAKKDFIAIPYADSVILRAPLAPGGVHAPLIGKEALRTTWWPPLVHTLSEVKVIEHYLNESMTAIITEAEVYIANPPAVLRVADRFTVDAAGQIVEQENHFDPRDVTNPGWQQQSGYKDIPTIVRTYPQRPPSPARDFPAGAFPGEK